MQMRPSSTPAATSRMPCGGVEGEATTSMDLASLSTVPSTATSEIEESSDLPAAVVGKVTIRLGNAEMGTAHEPGAIECPSDRAAIAGSPRSLMKLPRGRASAGATVIASATCDAASAAIVAVTVTLGLVALPRHRGSGQQGQQDSASGCARIRPSRVTPAYKLGWPRPVHNFPPTPPTTTVPGLLRLLSPGCSYRLPCDFAHSMNCWNRRSCSAGSFGAALAACARTTPGSMAIVPRGACFSAFLASHSSAAGNRLQPFRRRIEVGLLPLGVARAASGTPSNLEKNASMNLRDAAIAVGVARPVVDGQHGGDGDGVDASCPAGSGWDSPRCVSLAGKIVLLERLRVGHRQQRHAGLELEFGERARSACRRSGWWRRSRPTSPSGSRRPDRR